MRNPHFNFLEDVQKLSSLCVLSISFVVPRPSASLHLGSKQDKKGCNIPVAVTSKLRSSNRFLSPFFLLPITNCLQNLQESVLDLNPGNLPLFPWFHLSKQKYCNRVGTVEEKPYRAVSTPKSVYHLGQEKEPSPSTD